MSFLQILRDLNLTGINLEGCPVKLKGNYYNRVGGDDSAKE